LILVIGAHTVGMAFHAKDEAGVGQHDAGHLGQPFTCTGFE
jgi:hypothetical protein